MSGLRAASYGSQMVLRRARGFAEVLAESANLKTKTFR
tara:strand:- start:229 stop:342 length:114 start_codon:yes stop_codon:yes gene_type:complete